MVRDSRGTSSEKQEQVFPKGSGVQARRQHGSQSGFVTGGGGTKELVCTGMDSAMHRRLMVSETAMFTGEKYA